ncbi:molybdate ABC transporter permease subunit [Paradesulfitobacterium ferrireducens]|uniref:molybdate ABC transporter permease subunit n=1 Tax=Paradesulfitobacterium ferrireducens TaxID=2816476 RepID=UPI001A9098F0|nr:molybdate ABC transporter permease subunit [Paradesulfitobacterium ferrireducens]
MTLFPLYLSLKVAFFATLLGLIAAVPLAWAFTQYHHPLIKWFNSLTTLPLILPPTVLGYYLLVLVGRQSAIGQLYEQLTGKTLVFSWQGAVLASSIVSFPLLISAIRNAMSHVSPDLIAAARLLGHSNWHVFWTIVLPLSWRGIISGVALAFARAMGDFGATLMVAGNIPGVTQTMSIAVYDAMMSGDIVQANFLALIMTAVAIIVLFLLYRLEQKVHHEHDRNV